MWEKINFFGERDNTPSGALAPLPTPPDAFQASFFALRAPSRLPALACFRCASSLVYIILKQGYIMNINNLDSFLSGHGLTPQEVSTLASKLLTTGSVKFAYAPFWQWFISEKGSTLPVPTKDIDVNWKDPVYASGLSLWLSICQINNWN